MKRLFRPREKSTLAARVFDSVTEAAGFPRDKDGYIQWPQDDAALPWFDRADAMDTLQRWHQRGEVSDAAFEYLRQWIVEGFFIVPGLIDHQRTRAFREEIDAIWEREEAYDGLLVSDVTCGGTTHVHMPHAQVLALPEQKRLEARRVSHWRIGGLHLYAKAAKAIFEDEQARLLSELVFRTTAIPRYSLAFHKGSQQQLHQDTPVFHVYPRNHLIGVWIACEDIQPDAGPLVYCPGSHREPLFPEFDNYPQTNRRTCDDAVSQRYDQYVTRLADHYRQTLFLPREGDALFWHGQLIHGGMAIEDPDTTRYSFVVHYMAQGTDVGAAVQGPVNW
ncbi:MAG: phytanoyl-CoA dioxygenase family protein [Halieaceae bacterium]|nr:phytanoyl-CoA dioxygenase family protein [Halieaceae bacterium]